MRLRSLVTPRMLLPAAAVVVVAAVVVPWLVSRDGAGEVTASVPPPLTAGQADQLVDDLTSGEEGRLRRAYAVADDADIDPQTVDAFTDWDIELDATTFTLIGEDSATVEATTTGPDGQTEQWTVFLVPVEGSWLVSLTLAEE